MDLAKAVQAGKLDAAWLANMAAKSKDVSGYDILEVMGPHRLTLFGTIQP